MKTSLFGPENAKNSQGRIDSDSSLVQKSKVPRYCRDTVPGNCHS